MPLRAKSHSDTLIKTYLDGWEGRTSGGKDFARPNGDQLAAFVLARHVVEDGGIIDEGVQLPRDMPCPQDQ